VGVGQLVAFERVLHRTGRRDDRAAAAAELLLDVHRGAGPGGHAALERAGVAAVEQKHDAPGAAAVHPPVDEVGGDRGRNVADVVQR
jgi:hypothetical protein